MSRLFGAHSSSSRSTSRRNSMQTALLGEGQSSGPQSYGGSLSDETSSVLQSPVQGLGEVEDRLSSGQLQGSGGAVCLLPSSSSSSLPPRRGLTSSMLEELRREEAEARQYRQRRQSNGRSRNNSGAERDAARGGEEERHAYTPAAGASAAIAISSSQGSSFSSHGRSPPAPRHGSDYSSQYSYTSLPAHMSSTLSSSLKPLGAQASSFTSYVFDSPATHEQRRRNGNTQPVTAAASSTSSATSPPNYKQRQQKEEEERAGNGTSGSYVPPPERSNPNNPFSSPFFSPSPPSSSSASLTSAAASDSTARAHDVEGQVSASELEADILEAGAAASATRAGENEPEPLLLEYKKANSSIRKDFTTVDWFFARANMHRVRRLFRAKNARYGWKGQIKNMFLAVQGWMVLMLVGVCTAVSASLIHSVSAWLSDLKDGYCSGHNVFLTRRVCCMDEQAEGQVCQAWSEWNAGVAHEGSAGAFLWTGSIYIMFATLFGFLGSWLCVVYSRAAAGSGIAEIKIMLGGFVLKKFLGIRTLFFKTIGLTLAVASGMSLGKEGPMVHIACAWGHILSRPFLKYATNEVKKAEILSASVAAGVTAAFGSPLGGVLFSLEVVSSYFPPKTMWRSFWCAICTALVLQWLDPFQTGKLVQFAITINKWQWFEIFPFILIGCMGGMMGSLFIKISVIAARYRRSSRWLRAHPTWEVTILALVTAFIAFPNMFMRGNAGSLLAQLFTNCETISVAGEDDRNAGEHSVMRGLCDHDDDPWVNMTWMLAACIFRYLLTTITYGSAIPSGVFMPSLVIGALMGRMVGWLMLLWHKSVGDAFIFSVCAGKTYCISPALYAVIGAASMLGGSTRMTLALAVIMFEITGGLATIVPIMVAVVCSKWIGDAFGKQGLYGRLIGLNGLPHLDTHQELELTQPAAEVMAPDPVCLLTYGQTLQNIKDLLANEVYHGFPIIDNAHDRLITGFIARSDLEMELDKVSAADWSRAEIVRCHFSREPPPFAAPHFVDLSGSVDKYPIQIRPSMPVDRVLTLFQSLGLRYLLCCSPRGRIMGIIKKKDILLFIRKKTL